MNVEEMLRDEIVRVYTMESGLVSTFDFLEVIVADRKLKTAISMLIDSADRHLVELERTIQEEGWPRPSSDHPMTSCWNHEMDLMVHGSPQGPATDAICAGLLRRAICLRIPCYENARLYAFYAERPILARKLRVVIEEEESALARIRIVAELGVSFGAAVGGGPLSPL